ncbi:oxidoreductase [Companilactobacillus sp. RD055328]|uniref:aldo/keto reductase n=1 Tax=Companilactobacillus sp. RD055328 TaxID=2916634 RepID=UPI00208BBAE1|nr:aldo/keto reductase [Companilactobacillus sp. RD055328]GKQ42343.1 oxidoreductase [Companilactobacillus sp. RD055328]
MTNVPNITLNNGVEIPQFGFGVYKMQDKDEFMNVMKMVFEAGYRHIDTAAYYGNEEWLGQAIKESGIAREDFFITSKLWNADHGYEETKVAFEKTMKRLDLDYLDLYLIHWPSDHYVETWKAMEEFYKQGRIKAIGVSNFQIHHLEDLMSQTEVIPVINQIETHPYFQQDELREFMSKNNIAHEAWGPLGQGKSNLLTEPILVKIAENHNKSVGQIILRWHVQRGTIVFPKSVHKSRLEQNIDVFDFELTDQEMKDIKGLETGKRLSGDPDDVEFLKESAKKKID